MKLLVKAFLAGIMIAVGGTIYLMMDNPIIGACFFALGLFAICNMHLKLYTGEAGFMITKDGCNGWQMIGIFIGNYLGTLAISALLSTSRIWPGLLEKAYNVVTPKLNDSYVSLFALGVMCGVLMFIAVFIFRHAESPVNDALAPLLAIPVFILSGYEHCIADMFYFNVTFIDSGITLDAVIRLMIITLGNTIGSLVFSAFFGYAMKDKDDRGLAIIKTHIGEDGQLHIDNKDNEDVQEFLEEHPDAVEMFKRMIGNEIVKSGTKEDDKEDKGSE